MISHAIVIKSKRIWSCVNVSDLSAIELMQICDSFVGSRHIAVSEWWMSVCGRQSPKMKWILMMVDVNETTDFLLVNELMAMTTWIDFTFMINVSLSSTSTVSEVVYRMRS